jgi:hypothetical protein
MKNIIRTSFFITYCPFPLSYRGKQRLTRENSVKSAPRCPLGQNPPQTGVIEKIETYIITPLYKNPEFSDAVP